VIIMKISEQDQKLWSEYYSRGEEWFRSIPPDLLVSIVEVISPVEIPEQAADIFARASSALTTGAPALATIVLNQTKRYIQNPDECTPSSWTYHTLKYIDPVDTGYFDDALKGFPDTEAALNEIHCSADQLVGIKPCFSFTAQLEEAYPYTRDVLIPKACNFVAKKAAKKIQEMM
jgi:hypothetical protein